MSIQQDYELYGIEEDRLPGDTLVLPASWEQIKIKPNELILGETINFCIDKIYENTLYIFSQSIIPTNDIPVVKYAENMIIDTGHTQATLRLGEGEFETHTGEISQPVTIKSTIDGPTSTIITGTSKVDGAGDPTNVAMTINEIIISRGLDLTVIGTGGDQQLAIDTKLTIEGGEFVNIEMSRNTSWSASTQTDNDLQGIKHLIKTTNGYNPNNYNIFACTSTNVMIISGAGVDSLGGNRDSINMLQNSDVRGAPIVSNSSITHPSNGIHFRDIRGLVLTDAKDLFILDGDHKQIFKFDVSGTIYLDPAILKNDTPGRLLTLMAGGDGLLTDKTNFLNPVKILTINNLIYVLDYDTSTKQAIVKVFDSALNWRKSFPLGKLHENNYIDFEYNSDTNRFYVLVHSQGEKPEMITFDFDFNRISTDDLMDIDKHSEGLLSEQYLKIVFSIETPNVYYILSKHNVFKKYLTKPLSFLGQFKLDERQIGPGPDLQLNPTRDLVDLFIHPVKITDGVNTLHKDEMLIFEATYPGIYQFLEDSGYKQSFESTVESKLLPIKDVYIKPDEPVDTLTYNKLLYKLLYNNTTMLQNISRKFATQFDSKGFARYVGFKYLNIYELADLYYETDQNNYISGNEIVLAETVNRCLKKVYDIQVKVLSVMQERSLNVFPLTDRPVILT